MLPSQEEQGLLPIIYVVLKTNVETYLLGQFM